MKPVKKSALASAFAATIVLLWCVSPGLTHGAAAEVPLLRVALQHQAQVSGGQVLLGDVAALTSPNLSLLRRAMALPLGYAPRVGDSVTIEVEQLNRALRRQFGLNADEIKWEGATTALLSTAVQEVSGDALVAIAQSALRQHLAAMVAGGASAVSRIELEVSAVPPNVVIPVAAAEFRVRPLDNLPLRNRAVVWIDVFSGGRHVRTVPVRFDVGIFALMPVATKPMTVGADLSPDNVTLREVDVARRNPDVRAFDVANKTDVLDGQPRSLRRAVRAGEVLESEKVMAKPAVSRGDWVSIISQSGAVSLKSRVEVLQDGQVGQTVRARALNANGAMLARVVAPGQLELSP